MRGDQAYLDAIGREPMLTAAEELHLARLVQASQQPGATDRDRKRGLRARNRMIRANMRLVVSVAGKLQHRARTMAFQDLVQEGTFGLMRAAEKFDPSLGYKFSTYAYHWIMQSLTRVICYQDRLIRVPLHIGNQLFQIRREIEEAGRSGRSMTMQEAAAAVGLQGDSWRDGLAVASVASISQPAQDHASSSEIAELLPAPVPEPPAFVEDFGLESEELSRLVNRLEPELRRIIRGHFGLDGDPVSQIELSQELGITRHRVSYQAQKALRRLRKLIHHYQRHDSFACSGVPDLAPDCPPLYLERTASGQPTGAAVAAA